MAASGARPLLVDVSCLGKAEIEAEVGPADVLAAVGLRSTAELEGLPRGERVRLMGVGAGRLLANLPGLDAALFLGGNQGAAIAALAGQELGGRLNLVLATTVPPAARGPGLTAFRVLQLTADLVGPLNPVNAPELRGAISALGLRPPPLPPPAVGRRGLAAVSTLGNTEPLALAVVEGLRRQDFTPVVFHASGPGGTRLESLVREGHVDHVVEVAPHELVGEVLGHDLYRASLPRLAHRPGARRVFLPGSLDYYCLGSAGDIPPDLRRRPRVMHNPLNANVLTSAPERVKLARSAGARLGAAGAALVPMRGWSQSGAQGMPLYDPAGISAFADELARHLPVRRLDAPINSARVGQAVLEAAAELWAEAPSSA